MTNLKIYCVSDIPIPALEKLDLILAGVGEKKFPNNYISCLDGINIQNGPPEGVVAIPTAFKSIFF